MLPTNYTPAFSKNLAEGPLGAFEIQTYKSFFFLHCSTIYPTTMSTAHL
jgi:hypothetical protein